MFVRCALLALLLAPPALAAEDSAAPKRGGMAFAVELGAGGDSLDSVTDTNLHAGDGLTAMVGGFYRPSTKSPLEIYALAGYDFGFVVPVQGAAATMRI